MVLDGLQNFLLENLFPEGAIDYGEGHLIRFADDIFITSRSRTGAEKIKSLVIEFLTNRGLRLSEEKSRIGNIAEGFEFLSYWYQKKDWLLTVKPSRKAVRNMEESLERYILNYNGPIRPFIQGLNRKLGGWGRYHRVTDAREDFLHIDRVVQGLLLKKTRLLHPKRQLGHITSFYWYKDAQGRNVFAEPNKKHISVMRLEDMQPAVHQPVKTTFNPYLDHEYYDSLIIRRDINKVSNEKYRAVWQRQQGQCYFCGHPMLPDHELDIIQIRTGSDKSTQNMAYIHKRCANICTTEQDADMNKEALNVVEILEHVLNENVQNDDPYYYLRLFFYECKKSPITLTFSEIEKIIGDELDMEAYFCEAFWYDKAPGFTSELWVGEFPFHAIRPAERIHCIANAWISQGYIIQRLRLLDQRVIFRKKAHGVSGISLPRELFEKKLPKNAVYEIEDFIKTTLKKYGII